MDSPSKLDLNNILNKVITKLDSHLEQAPLRCNLVQLGNDGHFRLEVESDLQGKLFANRYLEELKRELELVFASNVTVTIKVNKGHRSKKQHHSDAIAPHLSLIEDTPASQPPAPLPKGSLRGNIRTDYRLDNFVIGDCNRLAVEAIRDIVIKGKAPYYPLYLYSSCGLGKSHLLQGFCAAVFDRHPHLKICYIACDEFVNDFIESLRNNKQNEFREKYRQIDVLVVDDVHFLSTKKASQEEFVHTFNALQNSSGTLVLSSDAPPVDSKEIKQHLRDRFGGGLVLELDLPDYETRVKILTMKLQQKMSGKPVNAQWMKVIEYISSKNFTNVREYEGALNRVLFSIQNNGEMNGSLLDCVRELLKENRTWTIADCFRLIKDKFGVPDADLKSRARNRELSLARSFLIRLMREKLNMSLKDVGKLLGRAHTSILELDNKTIKKINSDPEWRSIWESLNNCD